MYVYIYIYKFIYDDDDVVIEFRAEYVSNDQNYTAGTLGSVLCSRRIFFFIFTAAAASP